MDIFGASEAAPQQVILEASPDKIGDVLSIHLSQKDPASAAVWMLFVDVHIAQGWFRLGQLTTNTVAVDGVPSRCVGFGACPGAIGWRVQARCATDGEQGDLVIQSSKQGAPGLFGVFPAVVVPPIPPVPPSPPVAGKFTSSAWEHARARVGAAELRSVYVSSKSSDQVYLFVYDAAAAPADASPPDFPPIPIPAGAPAFLAVSLPEGRDQAIGIALVISTTQDVLTQSSADDFYFEAHFLTP